MIYDVNSADEEELMTTTMTNLAQLGMQLRSLHMDGHDGSCHGSFLQVYIVQVCI